MYFAYKLNKQGDNIQHWRTPFPIWNQSVVPCPVLTVASWPAYRFLRSQVKLFSILISWRIFHSLFNPHKVFGIVNKAKVDILMELSCFFDDPADFGNSIFGSSAFSKSSLNIWKFTFHVLLKPGLEHLSITLIVCEISAIVQLFEHSLALPFFGLEWKLTFSSPVATAEFSKFAGVLSAALSQHYLLGFEIA